MAARPQAVTCEGFSPKERTPITGFFGFESMSRQGAKSRLKPSARSRLPVRAARSRTSGGPPEEATARAGGGTSQKWESLETMPPSSSTVRSAGSCGVPRSAWSDRVQRAAPAASA